jgi:hypothetical protein
LASVPDAQRCFVCGGPSSLLLISFSSERLIRIVCQSKYNTDLFKLETAC